MAEETMERNVFSHFDDATGSWKAVPEGFPSKEFDFRLDVKFPHLAHGFWGPTDRGWRIWQMALNGQEPAGWEPQHEISDLPRGRTVIFAATSGGQSWWMICLFHSLPLSVCRMRSFTVEGLMVEVGISGSVESILGIQTSSRIWTSWPFPIIHLRSLSKKCLCWSMSFQHVESLGLGSMVRKMTLRGTFEITVWPRLPEDVKEIAKQSW